MRVTGNNAELVGAEGASPPLPFIELDDAEAADLIGRGYAVSVEPAVEAEPVVEPEPVVEAPPVVEPEPNPAAEPEVVAEPNPAGSDGQSAPAATDEQPVAEPGADVVDDDPHSEVDDTPEEKAKLETIMEHMELLTDEDMVATGARAGRPKVSAMKAALGFDVTVEEVDAAWDLRQAEQHA